MKGRRHWFLSTLFLISLNTAPAPAYGAADASLDPRVASTKISKQDASDEACANLAIMARRDQAVRGDSPLLAQCAVATRSVCEQTAKFLRDSRANQGEHLLAQCSGPVVQTAGLEGFLAGCRVALLATKMLAQACSGAPVVVPMEAAGVGLRAPKPEISIPPPGISGQ